MSRLTGGHMLGLDSPQRRGIVFAEAGTPDPGTHPTRDWTTSENPTDQAIPWKHATTGPTTLTTPGAYLPR